MKDDRALLEAAAKASGLAAYWDVEYGRMVMDYHHKGGINYEEWNPLEDDGDALRLAVKLQIQVTPGTYNKDEFTAYNSAKHAEAHERWSPQTDEYAATRRAIVRAAASMAKERE